MMEKIYESNVWETELESLIEFFEKTDIPEDKKPVKVKSSLKFYKSFVRPRTINIEPESWTMAFCKNLKKYFFKKNLKKVYETQLFNITSKHRKVLRHVIFKAKHKYVLKLKKNKKIGLNYTWVFLHYTWFFLNKKLIFYLKK